MKDDRIYLQHISDCISRIEDYTREGQEAFFRVPGWQTCEGAMRPKVEFVEVVADTTLRKKEKEATEAVKRLCADCGPVRLYRTADGRVGIQLQVSLVPGNRKLLDDIYRAVMRVIGQRRGRPVGQKTVQTKLRLPEPVHDLLKRAAEKSHATMSSVVADSLLDRLDVRLSPERRRSHS